MNSDLYYYLFLLKEIAGLYYPSDIIGLIINLANDKPIISCGIGHVAICWRSDVWIWGSNVDNRLGFGDDSTRELPTKLFLGEKIKSVSCGSYHTIALSHMSNKIWVWGRNDHGQLGLGHVKKIFNPQPVFLTRKIVQINCGVNHTVALTDNNSLCVWDRIQMAN